LTDKKLTLQEAEDKMIVLKKEVGGFRELQDKVGKEINKVMFDTYGVQEGAMSVEKLIALTRRIVDLSLYEKGITKEDPRDTVKPKNEKPESKAEQK